MKIFSTFDTEFKEKILEKEKNIFNDKVLIIQHGKFFYYFLVILPAVLTFIAAILYIGILIYLSKFIENDFITVYWVVWLIVFLVIFLPLGLKILKKYIDYKLDFVIVTPNELIYYNQEWILTRKWRTIDTEKIKTITVTKSGLIRSIFNFGNITVLSEWDEQGEWEINFSFVDDPENLKMKMIEIIKEEEEEDLSE